MRTSLIYIVQKKKKNEEEEMLYVTLYLTNNSFIYDFKSHITKEISYMFCCSTHNKLKFRVCLSPLFIEKRGIYFLVKAFVSSSKRIVKKQSFI